VPAGTTAEDDSANTLFSQQYRKKAYDDAYHAPTMMNREGFLKNSDLDDKKPRIFLADNNEGSKQGDGACDTPEARDKALKKAARKHNEYVDRVDDMQQDIKDGKVKGQSKDIAENILIPGWKKKIEEYKQQMRDILDAREKELQDEYNSACCAVDMIASEIFIKFHGGDWSSFWRAHNKAFRGYYPGWNDDYLFRYKDALNRQYFAREDLDRFQSTFGEFRQSLDTKTTGGDGDGCFLPETQVCMADGSLKPIADVKKGDWVKAYDTTTGKIVSARVIATDHGEADIHFEINDEINVVPPHPFLTAQGKWKRIQDLKKGDIIKGNPSTTTIQSIEKVKEKSKIYNIHLGKYHNYFVTLDGKNTYLVKEGL
jgi:hypothetical protein